MAVIVINIATQQYLMVEPKRTLVAKQILTRTEGPILVCGETLWQSSIRKDIERVEIPVQGVWKPISEFYTLDPLSVETDVYSWSEGTLSIRSLSSYAEPKTLKEREEIKRDCAYTFNADGDILSR